jgi:SAM-dependent methyltransferase
MAIRPGESVLDVGCGTGVFLPGLVALVGGAGRVVGLDHSPAFLGDARKRLAEAAIVDRVELVEGDAHHLPFPEATFDVAHCERVLMHLEDPAAAVREMCRVVRPGGRLLVAEVYAAGARIAHPDLEAEQLVSAQLVSGIRNSGMGLAVRGLLVEAGLRDVGGEVVGYFEEELDQDEAEEWAAGARALAARGRLDPSRAEAAIAAMEESRAAGTYCGTALIFVVSGRVPDGDRDAV